MPTGFSNEKSTEYVVLYDLYEKVKDICRFFYPFIYQSKRDDTILSLQNEVDDLHLVICFARRPKAYFVGDDRTIITFRRSLFSRANYFREKGITSIIGAPIGTSIENIGFGAHCQWFSLEKDSFNEYTSCIVKNDSIIFDENSTKINVLDDSGLQKIFINTAIFQWKEIIELIQQWYYLEKNVVYNRFMMSMPGQRPIFIAYKLKDM